MKVQSALWMLIPSHPWSNNWDCRQETAAKKFLGGDAWCSSSLNEEDTDLHHVSSEHTVTRACFTLLGPDLWRCHVSGLFGVCVVQSKIELMVCLWVVTSFVCLCMCVYVSPWILVCAPESVCVWVNNVKNMVNGYILKKFITVKDTLSLISLKILSLPSSHTLFATFLSLSEAI